MELATALYITNKIATLPICGSVIAVARFSIAVLVGSVALVILTAHIACTFRGNEFLEAVCVMCLSNMAFSTIEVIPFIGTLLHVHYKDADNDCLSLGYKEENALEKPRRFYEPITLLKIAVVANVLGAIPGIGTIIGLVRIILSSLVGMVAITILGAQVAFIGKPSSLVNHIQKIAISHFLLGWAEIIPVIGTLTHYLLNLQLFEESLLSFSHDFRSLERTVNLEE